jgi:branched-chain amino acid transport system permease protein
VVGQAGLLDLGFVAFYAIGAYTVAYLGTEFGWNFWATLVLGVVFAATSGVILGAPTLRLRGDYLAIVTLGFGEIVRITAVNTPAIGGARGITPIPHPPPIFGIEFKLNPLPYYYLILFFIVLAIVFSLRLQRSRVGRAWTAIREDEDAAELMGVPTFKFKLLAFAIGAMVGGLAGTIFASKVIFIAPTNFPFILSATILAAILLGGSGNLPGVILGAFLIAWLPERFRGFADYRILVFGAALVLMMALRPQGLLPSRQRSAEFKEGTGGMGSMGAGVAGPVDPESDLDPESVEAGR